jgi:hypothetical protein
MPVLSSLSGHEVNDIATSGGATPLPSDPDHISSKNAGP